MFRFSVGPRDNGDSSSRPHSRRQFRYQPLGFWQKEV